MNTNTTPSPETNTPEPATLRFYFAMVADPARPQAPISADIPAFERPMVARAIECFTGAVAHFSRVAGKRWLLHVEAAGYAAGPCC